MDFIYGKATVTIKNGKITEFEILEHRNEWGEAAESVVDRIIEEQKVAVHGGRALQIPVWS